MIDIDKLTEQEFQAMPLVVEGESKEVRYAGDGLVVIRFKPTIYSFTHNRAGVVEGSDVLRLRATRVLVSALQRRGVNHAYRKVNDRWVLANLLTHPHLPGARQFRPTDVDVNRRFKGAPPIEVVVKRMHSGTSKHRYHGMAGYPVRPSHPLYKHMNFTDEGAYPEPLVRFDWRNPLKNAEGKWLADEVLGDQQANWFIDVAQARKTALTTFNALANILNDIDIVLYYLCLFVSEDGGTVYGEISQDCGRFRHFDHGSLDKDVWRAGGSSEEVLRKWELLAKMLEHWSYGDDYDYGAVNR